MFFIIGRMAEEEGVEYFIPLSSTYRGNACPKIFNSIPDAEQEAARRSQDDRNEWIVMQAAFSVKAREPVLDAEITEVAD